MKTALTLLAVIVAHLGQAGETNRLTPSSTGVIMRVIEARQSAHPLLLGSESGQTPVLVMEPLQSPAFRDLFPKWTAYRLISSRDIVHQAHFSALLVDTNGSPSHLQSDEDVAFVLGGLSDQVQSREDALRLVRAFADLRSYRVVETPPDFPDARKPEEQPAPADTDYRFVAEEHKDGWRVFATFFTSEYSSSYKRYVIRIPKPPGGGLLLDDPVLIRLGNYVL